MTINLQFNDTQLNQTYALQQQDQPGNQLGLWLTFSISILSAGFIILLLESLKRKSNGVYPEGVGAESPGSVGATEVSEDNTNPDDFNVNGFFSVLSDEQAQSNQSTRYCPT